MHKFTFSLAFRVFHPTMAGPNMNGLLGLKPSVCQEQGRPRTTPKGRPLAGVFERTYCCYELGEGSDEALVATIQSWTDYLQKRREALQRIRVEGGEFEFFLAAHIRGNGGIELPSELMASFSGLGIRLALDIYAQD